MFFASGLLLILYRGKSSEQFVHLTTEVNSYLSNHIGFSVNQILIGLVIFIVIVVIAKNIRQF